jgi:hypothetical protein
MRMSRSKVSSVLFCTAVALAAATLGERNALAQTCTITSLTGKIESTDSEQIGRFTRNGVGINGDLICPNPVMKPAQNLILDNSPRLYDVYHFANNSTTDGCFTFSLNWTSGDIDLFAAAYPTSATATGFDPANIQANFRGDINRAPNNTLTNPTQANPPFSMGIPIAAGTGVDIVVNGVNFLTSANPYTLSWDCGGGTTPITLSLTSMTSVPGITLTTPSMFTSAGSQVTFTAKVNGTPGTAPTGSVTFTDRAFGSTTATTLGSAPLVGDAVSGTATATFMTTAMGVGQRAVAAIYSGDANYAQHTSAIRQFNKVNAPFTFTSSANPQVFGGPVTFTATLPTTAPATTPPTGTVTILDAGTTVGTITLTNGTGTLSTGALAVGTHTLAVTYNGDNNYNVNLLNPAFSQVINKGNTTTTVAAAPNPQTQGGSVTLTATVAVVAPAAGTPGGTVTFLDGATTLGTGTLTTTAPFTATFSTSALAGGPHSITAAYGGNANFNASTSAAVTETIQLPSTTTVVADSDTQVLGQAVLLTATVSGAATVPNGLTVTFLDGATVLGTSTPAGGVATFSANLGVGVHSITARYEGDTLYLPSTSAPITVTITVAPSTTSVVSAPVGTAISGQTVTFTATVGAVFGGPVAGTVSFLDGAAPLGTAVPIVSGVAAFSTAGLSLGPHTITAVFNGDTNHDVSTGSVMITIVPATTTTTLVSSVNPSVFGQTTVLTATVASNGGTATGSVTFRDGALVLGGGPVALDASGVATLPVSSLAVASHNLTAVFTGPAEQMGSTSNTVVQVVTQAATTTTVTAPTTSVASGATVMFTATVAPVAPGAGLPSGTVTFSDGGTTLGTAPVSGGQATFSTSTLAVGPHSITAVYGGDVSFTGSTSAALSVTVSALSSTTSLTAAPNPQTFAGTVTLTATVSGSGTPTGSVQFFDGATSLGSTALASGQAVLTTSALAVGSHSLTATYGGDTDHAASTSAAVTEVINKAASSIAVTAVPNPSVVDQSVTITATVTSALGSPTGTVTFRDGGTTLGTGNVVAGVATLSTTVLGVGSHTLTAAYGGDATHDVATGTVTQVVNAIPTTTTLATSVPTTVFGQATTLTATVAPSTVTTTPTGSVTFKDGTTTLGTGPVALNASGVATLSVSSLAVGTHSLTAVYSGPNSFAGSTSAAVTQTVNKAATSTVVATSSSPVIPGTSVTFIAVVSATAPGAGAPTGNVTFNDGATVLGTIALSGGFATLSTSTLANGTHSITATYAGDGSFSPSTSAPLNETVSPTAVTAALTVSPTATTYGQNATFTATMTAAVGGTPTGMVTFHEGTTTLGTGTLDATGATTLTVHTLAAGSHTIAADYAGDSVHGTATASVTLTIAKRATATTLGSAPNPSVGTAQVTLTATTTVSATPTAGGTDLVALAGTVTFKDGATTLGTGTLAADGTATLTTTTLSQGSHTLSATFEGADDYATSTSANLTQQVNPPAPPDGGAGDGGSDAGATDAAGGDAQASGDAKDGGAGDATAGDAKDGAAASDAGADAKADATAAGDAKDGAAASDAGADAYADAGTKPPSNSGCGCELAGGGTPGATLFGASLVGVLLAFRRRRRR